MSESQVPSGESQNTNLHQESSPGYELQESSTMGLKIAIIVVVLFAGIAAGYGWLQHDGAQQLAAERADLRASLAQAKGQEDALTAKVNAMSAALAEEQAARTQAAALENGNQEPAKNEQFLPRTSEAIHHRAHTKVAHGAPPDDPRWKQIQNQLGDQQKELTESQKQIAETQANLERAKSDLDGNIQSARKDLGGDIARNHEELVSLEKKGERTYYEFNFERSKTYHHTGPISLALRKADAKHAFCDLQLLVDDKEISRKHVNLYESITLYPEGHPLPLEVVVNHISKDSVQGYVSAPKYKTTNVSTVPSTSTTSTSASVNPPAPAVPEVKLEHREEGTH